MSSASDVTTMVAGLSTACVMPVLGIYYTRHDNCRLIETSALASQYQHVVSHLTIHALLCESGMTHFLSAFYIYDYSITLDREVEFFWRGQITGPATLFLSTRYLALTTQLLNLVEYTSSTISAEVSSVFVAYRTSDVRR